MVALDRHCPSRWRLPCVLAALTPLMAVVLVSSSAAASSWVPVTGPLVSSIFLRSSPVVAIDERGTATEIWAEGPEEGSSSLESSRLTLGGSWSSPVALPTHLDAGEPAIADTPDGHTTAVWDERETNGQSAIYSSQISDAASWSNAALLSATGHYIYDPSVAVQADGTGAATWFESDQTNEEWIVATVRHGESWSSPLRLSASGVYAFQFARGVDLVANASGFLAVWSQYEPEGGLYSVHADQFLGGAWQGDQLITTSPQPIADATVANDEAGDATVVWVNFTNSTLGSATLRGGQWTTQPIEGSHQHVGCGTPQPGVGVDAAGASTAAWVDEGQIVTDTLPAGGIWAQPAHLTNLPETSGAYEADLGVDRAGDAALLWDRRNIGEGEGSSGIEATYRSAGGAWEAPVSLSSAGPELTTPSVAIDSQGWAVGSWGESPYQPDSKLRYAYAEPAASVSSTPSPAQAGRGWSANPGTSTASKPAGLGPVYLVAPRSRLRLGRHSHTLSAVIRNRNPFPVSGMATMSYYLLPVKGAHAASHSSSPLIAAVAHFTLSAYGNGRIHFRLSARALRRLFAHVPDSGHDLVSIRLVVTGASGQSSTGSSVYALDAPAHHVHRHGHTPTVPPGYRAPVDPWVKAHAAC
jgi:hypothetical protein